MNRNRTFIRSLLFAAAVPQVAFTQPVIFSVLNAASYSAAISPGSLISILGTNFAAEPLDAPSVSTPTSLGGVSVRFGDLSATLLYVSPNQVNAVIPFGAAGPLVMTSSGGSTTYNLRLTRDAPGIFTQGGAAPLFNANLKQIDAIHPQDVVILYATGLGPIDASGQVVDPVDVFLGERKAKVLSAGLAPGRPGVYQLSLVVPRLATDRLYIRSGGWQSNIVYLSAYSEDFGSVLIPAGNNTTNVNGTIEGLYPSGDPSFPHVACIGNTAAVPCGFESFSVTLHAGDRKSVV